MMLSALTQTPLCEECSDPIERPAELVELDGEPYHADCARWREIVDGAAL